MSILNEICENLQKGKSKIVASLVTEALEAGVAPNAILEEGLLAGMNIIGEKFKNNEIYVPEVLVAARAMNAGTQILKPHLAAEGVHEYVLFFPLYNGVSSLNIYLDAGATLYDVEILACN